MRADAQRALRVAALVIVLGGIAALAAASVMLRWDGERIDARAESELHGRLAEVAASLQEAQPPSDQGDAWLVQLDSGTVTPLGRPEVEPPVLTVAQSIGDSGTAERRIDLGGRLLVGALAVPDRTGKNLSLAVVTAIHIDSYEDDRTSRRTAVILGCSGALLLATLVSFGLTLSGLRRRRRTVEQQRSFLADAAHELRTPLAVIQASAGQALGRARTSEEYVRSLSEIRAAAERAGVGVGELLDLARLEAGTTVPRRAPLRLDLLVEEVVSGIRPDGVELEVISGDAVVVDGDMALLRQAITNVILNACARANQVRVSTVRHGREAVVEVVDDGPGFSAEMLPHVFHRFHRGDRTGGAGLGLAIVRRVAEAHGGRAEAENRGSAGAVVRLRLPASRD